MNIRWKEWIIISVGLTGSLILMNLAMTGNWKMLLIALEALALTGLVVWAKHPAYLAFGILAPFGISLGFIQQVPSLALALTICLCAVCIKSAARHIPARIIISADAIIIVFYLCLVVRYCMNPVLPGYSMGLSEDISGFRSWLDHLIGFTIVLFLGRLITSYTDVRNLFRRLLFFSVLFFFVFIAIMPIPGRSLTLALSSAGIFESEFSNGWRRFVFLPTMGQFMILGYLLPNLFGTTPRQGRILLLLGITAYIAGGNRGSILALFVTVGVIWLLKRKWASVVLLGIGAAGLMLLASVSLERGWIRTATPWGRVMSAFSPGLSTEIGAMGTMDWRIDRWKRAADDIRSHPWLGLGYEGVRGYFRFTSDIANLDPDMEIERDVATGGTHNGYVSSARSLGIPITVLFVLIMVRRVLAHIKQAASHRHRLSPLFEAHVFFCAYLVMTLFILMVGAEIRYPPLWLFIALGLIVERMNPDTEATGGKDVPQHAVAAA